MGAFGDLKAELEKYGYFYTYDDSTNEPFILHNPITGRKWTRDRPMKNLMQNVLDRLKELPNVTPSEDPFAERGQ